MTVLHAKLNARVIAATDLVPVLDEMRRCGASEPGIRRMATKAEFVAVALDRIDRRQANLLKQEMLASGGDVAVAHGACAEAVAETGAVLVGSRRQFETLLARLVEEPLDLPEIGEEIRRALDGYARRRFEIRMGSRRLTVGPKVALVGVVNVTPDSFSDGGRFQSAEDAVAHALQLADEGADILDIGGESTRPGSNAVTEDEELARVMPVIEALAKQTAAAVSIDTRHARVAREAVAAGACLANDVTAFQGDPEMARVVAESGAGAVLMHMLGEPKMMQVNPRYDNLMADICRHLRRGIQIACDAGITEDRIIVDPGIGFGKTLEHNLEILARLGQLRTLGVPVMVGPSRKKFIGQLTGVEPPAARTYGTAAACAMAVAGGALLLRVHDVDEMRQTVTVASAVQAAAEGVSWTKS